MVVAVSVSTAWAGPTLLKGTTAAATMQATRMPEAAACGKRSRRERAEDFATESRRAEAGPRDERGGRAVSRGHEAGRGGSGVG